MLLISWAETRRSIPGMVVFVRKPRTAEETCPCLRKLGLWDLKTGTVAHPKDRKRSGPREKPSSRLSACSPPRIPRLEARRLGSTGTGELVPGPTPECVGIPEDARM